MSMWIDCNPWESNVKVGGVGYLVETVNTNNGRTSFALHERPKRTNRSHEAVLVGWCGTTNNMDHTAKGVWKVVQVNKAGDRARIVRLHGPNLATFLAQDGHPDLMPKAIRDAWIAGDEDGDEAACEVRWEHGIDGIHDIAWEARARNANAHKAANIPDDQREVYYAGYEYGAKQRVQAILVEHESGK